MATTKITSIKSTESKALAYIADPKKTDNGRLIYTFCCDENPIKASKDFNDIRATGTGRNTVLSRHMIISFLPGEIIPERALEVGKEICDKLLENQYQYYLAVHQDKKHIHIHCIFNNVNMIDGYTFNSHKDQGAKQNRAWKKLRNITDEVCRKHLLSVVLKPEYSKGKSHYEWEMKQQNMSWKSMLKKEIDKVIRESENFDDFLTKCKEHGIEAVYNPEHKIDLKFRLKGQQRFTRAKTLGWFYESKQIPKRISMLKGTYAYVPRTKIRVTTTPEIQDKKYLKNYLDVQNMNEVSRALDTAAKYGVEKSEIESAALSAFMERGTLAEDINKLSTEIEDISAQIKVLKGIEKYRPIADEMENLTGFKRRKYLKEHSTELNEYTELQQKLKQWYPEGVVAPPSKDMEEYKNALIKERSEKSAQYKAVKTKADDLAKAQKTIEEYLRNERVIDEQSRKRKNGDLE